MGSDDRLLYALNRDVANARMGLFLKTGNTGRTTNFDYAAPLCEFLLLGNVATQFDEPIDYDPVAGKIAGNAEADALLQRQYRKGWSL